MVVSIKYGGVRLPWFVYVWGCGENRKSPGNKFPEKEEKNVRDF